jgi:membrane protein implicated in regulation of membrane protease activity
VLSEVAKFFSFRNIVYFTAFFGLTGTVLKITSIGEIITFLFSLGIGTFSAGFGYSLMRYLRNTESGESLNIFDLNGREAKVSIDISKSRKGKIVVESGGSSMELTAMLSDNATEESIHKGEKVIIIEVNKETAIVVKSDL